ncbi:MAG: hypothetical protein B7Y02_07930 [Rhodobacterales bacterium 17-64-5]|nr:MAG: hypothetical protein B7Y02_07930 [Rhodobacterales bacterium 17-64-5]
MASPETIKKEVSAFGHAHVIVMAYPDGFRDNEAARGELQSLLMQAAALQGFASLSASQIVLSIASREESRAIVLGYERQRGIVLEDRNSWCAAGQYEGAHHFVVGKYLIAK